MTKSTTGYTSKPLGPGADRFMLQPYSRYTNASRFAGETDGLEAIESVAKAYPIDRNRIVMTGFSMGGASAWSFIVHHADRWAAASAGAGFTETEVFLRGALIKQPQNAVQQTLWHMYDSTDYAVNTFNVPVVAYSGGIDAQKQAADAMAAAMLAGGPHARARDRSRDRARLRAPGTAAGPGSARRGRGPRPERRSERDSIHDLDAALQQDVLADGRCDGGGVAASPRQCAYLRRTEARSISRPRTSRALHLTFDPGLAPFPPGTKPTVNIDGASVALPPVGARRLSIGRPGQGGRRVATGRAARRHSPQASRTAGPDRRCVHGQLRVRAAERDSRCRRPLESGRPSRQTMRSANGCISSAANRASSGTSR